MRHFVLVLAVLALIIGCKTRSTAARGPAEPSISIPVVATTAPSARTRPATIIDSKLSTATTIQRVAEVFQELRFYSVDTAANRQQFPPRPELQDHFYARIQGLTADGHTLRVECKWLAEGRIRVSIVSDLDDNQHDFVMDRIRTALEKGPSNSEKRAS